jgi:teichoic acid transport system ATP-binding protein
MPEPMTEAGSLAAAAPSVDGTRPQHDGATTPAHRLLVATGLHVTYEVFHRRRPSITELFGRRREPRLARRIQAVRGVSLTVREGDAVGVIGGNGSGKSTLMRALAGVQEVERGTVRAVTRPTLLGTQATLKGNWTGWQSIEVGLVAQGVPKEDRPALREDIAEFTELGRYLDLPTEVYSSGMRARLYFAINTATTADLLIVDESLGTGDAAFRERATARMQWHLQGASGIVLVSHSMGLIGDLCQRVVWMHRGRIELEGPPDEVIPAYQKAARRAREGGPK